MRKLKVGLITENGSKIGSLRVARKKMLTLTALKRKSIVAEGGTLEKKFKM